MTPEASSNITVEYFVQSYHGAKREKSRAGVTIYVTHTHTHAHRIYIHAQTPQPLIIFLVIKFFISFVCLLLLSSSVFNQLGAAGCKSFPTFAAFVSPCLFHFSI